MTGSSKRASIPNACDYTKEFCKDWDRLNKTGRYDMSALKRAMLLLVSNDGPLGPEWNDHPLKGDWSGHRECHVGGDFLLIYYFDPGYGKTGIVVFVRAGSHADLFG